MYGTSRHRSQEFVMSSYHEHCACDESTPSGLQRRTSELNSHYVCYGRLGLQGLWQTRLYSSESPCNYNCNDVQSVRSVSLKLPSFQASISARSFSFVTRCGSPVNIGMNVLGAVIAVQTLIAFAWLDSGTNLME